MKNVKKATHAPLSMWTEVIVCDRDGWLPPPAATHPLCPRNKPLLLAEHVSQTALHQGETCDYVVARKLFTQLLWGMYTEGTCFLSLLPCCCPEWAAPAAILAQEVTSKTEGGRGSEVWVSVTWPE